MSNFPVLDGLPFEREKVSSVDYTVPQDYLCIQYKDEKYTLSEEEGHLLIRELVGWAVAAHMPHVGAVYEVQWKEIK